MDINEAVAPREYFSAETLEKYDAKGLAAFGEGYKFMGIVTYQSGPYFADYCNEKTKEWKTIVIPKKTSIYYDI